jgi:prevent-host-death family protein
MREIGVREFKDSLSQVLHDVSKGEDVRITLRGQPLAYLVPANRPSTWQQKFGKLVADGVVTPASARHPRPPKLIKTKRSASQAILSERDLEY